jgi:opacity protein-like surface antigen
VHSSEPTTTAVGIGGGQWGYNYQIQQYVLGFETDLDWVGGGKTATFTSLPNGFVTTNATQTAGLELAHARTGRDCI